MPNMLLVMSDEHNPFVSSVYGHSQVDTPNMARLAEQGSVYDAAYCPSPLCLPSRSAFMSGRHVHEIQCYSNCNHGLGTFPSYGQLLAAGGVHTVHIGKTDVYRPGAELGFSEMLLPRDRKPPGDTNHGRTPLSIRRNAARRANGYGPREEPRQGDVEVVEGALQWIADTAPALRQPWLLSVQMTSPHFPHFVTPDLWERYADCEDLPAYGTDCESAQHPYARDLRAHFQTEEFSEEDIRGLRRGYLGCVTFVDNQLGRLLNALEEAHLRDDTIVAYSSDHGDMLGRFGMWWKCSLYEPSSRVPLIVAGPGFSRGIRVRTPVTLLDLQAAIFHAAGVHRPREQHGGALQLLRPDDHGRTAFAEYHGHGTRSGAFMIRQGDWKLIKYMQGPDQLFDLSRDPDELCSKYIERPEIATRLERELEGICDPKAQNRRAHEFEQRQLAQIASAT